MLKGMQKVFACLFNSGSLNRLVVRVEFGFPPADANDGDMRNWKRTDYAWLSHNNNNNNNNT